MAYKQQDYENKKKILILTRCQLVCNKLATWLGKVPFTLTEYQIYSDHSATKSHGRISQTRAWNDSPLLKKLSCSLQIRKTFTP